MASIRKDIEIEARAEDVWTAVRDVGQAHRRLFPGLLSDAWLDGDARVVTFANGLVVRELIVSIDDAARRFAYAAVGGRTTHHNASLEVTADGSNRCRVVWTIDVLPDEVAGAVGALMEQGAQVMKRTLEPGGR